MNRDSLNIMKPNELRGMLGDSLVLEARAALQKGYIVERKLAPPGELTARWDHQPDSLSIGVKIDGKRLLLRCACPTYLEGLPCVHVTALILAWATEPMTFAGMFEGDEDSDLDEEDEYDDDDDEDEPVRNLRGGSEPAVNLAIVTGKEQHDRLVATYKKILSLQTMPEIREIARRRGVPITGLRKDPIVDALAEALAPSEKLYQDWGSLSKQARLLAGLIAFGPTPLQLGALHLMAESAGLKGMPVFEETFLELRHFGLVMDQYGQIIYPELLAYLLPPDPDFFSIGELDPARLRVQKAADPRVFYQTVVRLAMMLQSGGTSYQVRVNPYDAAQRKKYASFIGWPIEEAELDRLAHSGNLYNALVKQGARINPLPPLLADTDQQQLAKAIQTDPHTLDFALHLFATLGLLKVSPGSPLQHQGDLTLLVTQYDPPTLLGTLFLHYIRLVSWNEMDLALAKPKGLRILLVDLSNLRYSTLLGTLAMLREKLLVLIRRMPVWRWNKVNDLVDACLRLPFRNTLRPISRFIRFEVNNKRMNLENEEDCKQVFGLFVEAVLSGPLFWMGAVDLAWDGERLAGFRLTELGGGLLFQETKFQMPVPSTKQRALIFQADEGIKLNLESASSGLLQLLSQLGKLEITRQGEMIYRVTFEQAGRTFEAGWQADQILEVFSQAAGQTAPKALAEKLKRWQADFGKLQLYSDVALIELGDDFAVNELLAGTSLSRYLLYRFSSRLLAIRPEGVEMLRDELVKKGYTPRTVTAQK